jgi:hypothetical protein
MPYETITFPAIEQRVSKTAKCIRCEKRLRRATTISKTVNPFNRRADGTPKSRAEVGADVAAAAGQWMAAPVWCDPCGEVLRVRASQLAAGDLLVTDDGTETPVREVMQETGVPERIAVNPGPDSVWLSPRAWVTRFPAWDLDPDTAV